MEIKTFFFDTYALYEIAIGNKNYNPYTKNVAVVTTRLNLMELFYGLLTKYNKNIADKSYDYFLKYCINISDGIIKNAALFRAANAKKGLSYVDCIGYILAMELNIKFLTGDDAFRNMSNVEFIK